MTPRASQELAEKVDSTKGSYWPIVAAAVLTVAVVGLIVHPAIAVLGALALVVALFAWNLERFQGPSEVEAGRGEALEGLPKKAEGGALEAAEESGSKSGRWGLIWFITSEAVFFGNLIAAYLYLRVRSENWGPTEQHIELLFPLVNTIILLSSTIPSYYAHHSIRKGDRKGLQIGLGLAALLGLIFLAGQAYEYSKLGFTLQTNIFASGFFVLTGFHGAHVLVGVGLLLTMLVLSLRGRFSAQRNFPVEFATTYWHFVDVVWIFLFTTLYVI